jgi:hypothetical protein
LAFFMASAEKRGVLAKLSRSKIGYAFGSEAAVWHSGRLRPTPVKSNGQNEWDRWTGFSSYSIDRRSDAQPVDAVVRLGSCTFVGAATIKRYSNWLKHC